MQNKQVLQKKIEEIVPVMTGHGIGEKRVLLSMDEHFSCITQIAKTALKAGDIVEKHCHPTMDEHFIFLKGKCKIIIEDEVYNCTAGQYLLLPAATSHRIEVLIDTEMLTIGVVT